MVIGPANLRDVSYIVANLRPLDELEVRCQLPEKTTGLEIAYFLTHGDDAWVAYDKGYPVMAFGVAPLNVAAVSVWALGTQRAWRAVPAMTRYFIGEVVPELMERGYHTMEARSIVEHESAHRWMRSTGAVVQGEPFVYGRNREKFLLFRWSRDALAEARERYEVAP